MHRIKAVQSCKTRPYAVLGVYKNLGSGGHTTRSDVDLETKVISVKKKNSGPARHPDGKHALRIFGAKTSAREMTYVGDFGASGKLGEVFRDVVVETLN
jgi:hypothetical protein